MSALMSDPMQFGNARTEQSFATGISAGKNVRAPVFTASISTSLTQPVGCVVSFNLYVPFAATSALSVTLPFVEYARSAGSGESSYVHTVPCRAR